MSNWEGNTVTFEYLRTQALSSPDIGLMVPWLRRIGIIPLSATVTKGAKVTNTNLNPAAIPARYLAELAYEWDSWGGGSTPEQFVKALAFEVRGTEERAAFEQALSAKGGPAS